MDPSAYCAVGIYAYWKREQINVNNQSTSGFDIIRDSHFLYWKYHIKPLIIDTLKTYVYDNERSGTNYHIKPLRIATLKTLR